MPDIIGLKQRIRESESKMALGALMLEGQGYRYASGHTRRQWERISKEKLKEFNKEKNDAKKKSNK